MEERPVKEIVFDLAWLTPTVRSLAQAAYNGEDCKKCKGKGTIRERNPWIGDSIGDVQVYHAKCSACGGTGSVYTGTLDPHRLAVLADALEEAGCVGDPCGRCGNKGWVEHEDDHGFFHTGCTACGGDGLMTWRDGGGWSGPVVESGKKGTGRVPHPLLAHLRSSEIHVKGCWAIDLVLGHE